MQFLAADDLKAGQLVRMTTNRSSRTMTVATVERRARNYHVVGFADGATASGALDNVFAFEGVDTRPIAELARLHNIGKNGRTKWTLA